MHELLIFLARSMGQFLKRWLVCSYEFFFLFKANVLKLPYHCIFSPGSSFLSAIFQLPAVFLGMAYVITIHLLSIKQVSFLNKYSIC